MRLFLLLIILISGTELFAKKYELKSPEGQLSIDLGNYWMYLEKSMGIPHLFASKTSAPKDSVMVIPKKVDSFKLDAKSLAKSQKDYQNEKQNWAKSEEVKIQKFHDYEFKSLKDKSIHKIGTQYEFKGHSFTEFSYYLECKKSFILIKTTVVSDRTKILNSLDKAIQKSICL